VTALSGPRLSIAARTRASIVMAASDQCDTGELDSVYQSSTPERERDALDDFMEHVNCEWEPVLKVKLSTR
jgi:hypothetical protein